MEAKLVEMSKLLLFTIAQSCLFLHPSTVNQSRSLQADPNFNSPWVVALYSNDSTLAPYDGTPTGYFGVVEQCEGINEGILCHLRKRHLKNKEINLTLLD